MKIIVRYSHGLGDTLGLLSERANVLPLLRKVVVEILIGVVLSQWLCALYLGKTSRNARKEDYSESISKPRSPHEFPASMNIHDV